ncbi:MAG: extracellular solute-binding protein, partial [Candidatus Rokubacteria bacterium]|nr:extracellular solute-binding protein [Candidatus Rokubacteria bacterium]
MNGRPALVLVFAAIFAACSAPAGRPTRSGGLVVYSAQAPELTGPILDAWRARTGVDIEVVQGGMGELLSRIRAERERPLGDLIWGGSPEMYALNADLFAPFESGEESAYLDHDPSRKWHAFSLNLIYLVVNTARAPGPLPTCYSDLLDPRWKRAGPIGFSNPVVSGTGYTIATALASVLGWEFLRDLLRNAWLTDSSDSMFKWVKDGETATGFLFEMTLRDYLAAGAPLAAALTEEGLIAQIDGFGLIAGAPHADAARPFLRYLASQEAHRLARGRSGRRSARRDVP